MQLTFMKRLKTIFSVDIKSWNEEYDERYMYVPS